MSKTLESRYHDLFRCIEGARVQHYYEFAYGTPRDEEQGTTPVNPWHRRILSELDFCLQMKAHAGVDVTAPVNAALDVLEAAYSEDGVITDSACKKAEQCLMPLGNAAKEYTLLLVGHAHLDMNWMWSWDETVASVIATFKTMLKLMQEYPQFRFSQSQASAYKIVEDYAPEIMPQIKERIAEGRWEVTVAAWVETDKNMPCLESLMNHLVYSRKYMQEVWGVDPQSLDIDFSPDTFGHSAFLPELSALGGVNYYYHCRGLGETDKILYRWKAPSGKDLLMYREPYWYNSGINPTPAVGLPRVCAMSGGLKTGMAVYGVGDHGGGPTRLDIERALEMQQWPIFPELKFGSFHDYFAAAEEVRDSVPVVEHELNGIFNGCFTTQSRIKRENRKAESTLVQAETLSALAEVNLGAPYSQAPFEKAWQKVLFTHFHDIITGSCTQNSREYAMGLYQEALSQANSRSAVALEAICSAIDTSGLITEDYPLSRSEGAGVGFVANGNIPTHQNGNGLTRILHIFNTTDVVRREVTEVTVWDWPGDMDLLEVCDTKGNVLEFERTSNWEYFWSHRYLKIAVTVEVPAYGYTTVIVRQKEPTMVTEGHLGNTVPCSFHPAFEKEFVLENDYIKATLDGRTGELFSIVDKLSGREYLRKGESAGLRYIDTLPDENSAWVIGRYLSVKPLEVPKSIYRIGGGLVPGVWFEQKIENSVVGTTVTLGKYDRFVRVKLHIDWHEHSNGMKNQPILTYTLPLDDTTDRIMCDVPGGVQWRPDSEQDVPCLQFGAAEVGDGSVLALGADSKYGFRLCRGELSVTLINTAHAPDPYPERGIGDVNLVIMPAKAKAAELTKAARAAFTALQYATDFAHEGTLPTTNGFLSTDGDSVVFTGAAIRDGKLALRMYEAEGASCPVTVTLSKPAKDAQLCDLFGNKLDIPVEIKGEKISFTLAPYTQAELRI